MSNESNTQGENEQLQPSIHLGGPFHPVVVQTNQGAEHFYGASMRDFLASNAPSEVPDWFKCTGLLELPALPKIPTLMQALESSPGFDSIKGKAEAVDEVLDYLHEGVEPERQPLKDIVAFARDMIGAARDAFKAAEQHRRQVMDENAARRFFAWRWHYADQMLKARGY